MFYNIYSSRYIVIHIFAPPVVSINEYILAHIRLTLMYITGQGSVLKSQKIQFPCIVLVQKQTAVSIYQEKPTNALILSVF
jgi:hypothetical protein